MQYQSSCENYRQVGYSEDGEYAVDLDRSGPMKPRNLQCQFTNDRTETSFKHNVPDNFVKDSYELSIKPRFTVILVKLILNYSRPGIRIIEHCVFNFQSLLLLMLVNLILVLANSGR